MQTPHLQVAVGRHLVQQAGVGDAAVPEVGRHLVTVRGGGELGVVAAPGGGGELGVAALGGGGAELGVFSLLAGLTTLAECKRGTGAGGQSLEARGWRLEAAPSGAGPAAYKRA